jgi:protein phosphatase
MGRYGETQGADATAPAHSHRGKGRSARKVIGVALAVLLVLGLAAGATYALLSRSFFVGDADGQVAVFNGVPQDVLGLPLFRLRETSDLPTADLTTLDQGRVAEGVAVDSLTDARETIERYRARAAEEVAPTPAATPTPAPGSTADPGTTATPTPAPDAAPTP